MKISNSFFRFSIVMVLLFVSILASAFYLDQNTTDPFDAMVNKEIKKSIPLIYTDELKSLIAKKSTMHLLDTRELDEFNVSHIQNAKWVGYSHFNVFTLKDIDKSDTLLLYCSVGVRSEKTAEKLKKYGFKNVFNLFGGIFRWVNAGYPVVDHKNANTQKIHPYNESWGKWLVKGIKSYE